jgi:hypothetical protein
MGLFSFIKKEKYINQLVVAYKMVYGCGDMAAIECMRRNYTEKELKEILQTLKESENQGSLQQILFLAPPFIEQREEVMEMDRKHNRK